MNMTTNSYILYRNNRRFNNKVFATYEQARNYVRKLARASKAYPVNSDFLRGDYPQRIAQNSIPLSVYGFAVKRVASNAST